MRVAVLLASTAVALGGCAHTVTGAPAGDPVLSIAPVRAGDAGQVLLTPAQVSEIAGSRLQLDADRTFPVTGASAAPACSALDAVGMAAFVGSGWSQFRMLLFTDGDQHDRVLSEAVAIYPDPATAAAAFDSGTADAGACDGQDAVGVGGDAAWRFDVAQRTPDALRWTKRQLGIPLTWVCHAEARLRNNAVIQAMGCQGDDAGRLLATRLADEMSAAVWELSGR
jgi:hypothetical protein